MFLWITPMPPSCDMVIAISDSVTVSMAAEISGMFKVMRRVSLVAVVVDDGSTWE